MKKKRKIGLPPGTMVYTGGKTDIDITVSYVEYNEAHQKYDIFEHSEELPIFQNNESIVQWYDVRGLHDVDLIQKLAQSFGVHPLALEDIVDVNKRPSYVEYKNGHFISLKSFEYNSQKQNVTPQTITVYFGKGFVLSFQEHEDDIFKDLRDRIIHGKGRIRQRASDYLAYAIVDNVVDHYYRVIDDVEETLEEIEFAINNNPDDFNKGKILQCKVNLIKIRKSVIPLREALNQFIRNESDLIDERTEVYLKDVYDHTIQIVESADTLRDILGGLQDLYISEISLKMNRVMQFLTIVTAVFVPLSFLTGLYGMNFEYIPELKYHNGYFILWAFMLIATILMILYFRKKKWL